VFEPLLLLLMVLHLLFAPLLWFQFPKSLAPLFLSRFQLNLVLMLSLRL